MLLQPFLRRWMADIILEATGLAEEDYNLHFYLQRCSARLIHSKAPQHTSCPFPGVVHLLRDAPELDAVFTVGVRGLGFNVVGLVDLLVSRMKDGAQLFSTLGRGDEGVVRMGRAKFEAELRDLLVQERVWKSIEGEQADGVITLGQLVDTWGPGGTKEANPHDIAAEPEGWVAHELFRGYIGRTFISFGTLISQAGGQSQRIPIREYSALAAQELNELGADLSRALQSIPS